MLQLSDAVNGNVRRRQLMALLGALIVFAMLTLTLIDISALQDGFLEMAQVYLKAAPESSVRCPFHPSDGFTDSI